MNRFNRMIAGMALIMANRAMGDGVGSRNVGVSNGGGGFAVVCQATPTTPSKVELLDLYEGSLIPNFVMTKPSGILTEDYFDGVKRTYTYQGFPDLAEQHRSEINKNLNDFLLSTRFVNTKDEMPIANDVGDLPWIASQCKIEQIAYFDDTTTTIYVLKSLWDKMDSMSQAALVHHELWYREMRNLKDSTSRFARRGVAHAFAVRGPVSITDGLTSNSLGFWIQPETQMSEGSPKLLSQFYVSSDIRTGKETIQFTFLQGRPLLAKAWVDLPPLSWVLQKSINNGSGSDVLPFICVVETPNQNYDLQLPIHGTMVEGLSLRIEYKSGSPVLISLYNKDKLLNTGMVAGGKNWCNGFTP